jgi:DNA-binding CsgD family transcriptional regulator
VADEVLPGGAAAALLERQHELDALASVLAAARSGAGAMLSIEGPAGIGKTRLLAAAAELARDSDIGVLSARASRMEREFSFGVALKLLGDRVRGDATDDVFAGAASQARPLFTGAAQAPERPSGDAVFSLLHGLHWLVANLAEKGPLLICVDDAHWADEPSLAFLNYLGERVEELPIAIAVAVRTGEPSEVEELIGELRGRHPSSNVLRPSSLSVEAAADHVRRSLPEADDEFCAACAEASGGNPFYLRELIAAAGADAVAPTAAGARRVAELSLDSVSRALLTRLGRLPPPARELAEAVAVLGDEVSLRHAAELAGGELADHVAAADRLAETDVLVLPEPISFVHPIVASTVYADIPPARRAHSHLRAAELLYRDRAAAEEVASHLLSAAHSGAEWVRRVLRAAAERAHARGDPRAALRYLRRALDESPPPPERGELQALAGLAEAETGEGTGTETLSEAVGLIEQPDRRAQALFDLAFVLTHGGRYPQAADAARRGREELGDADPALAAQLDALAAISGTYVDLTDAGATARHIEASLASPGLEGSPTGRAVLGNASIALAFAGASADELHGLAERALHRERPLDDPFDMITFPLAAFGIQLAGDPDASERASTAAVEMAHERGSILELGAAMQSRSVARFQAGRVVEALADAESAVDAGRWGWGATLPMAHAQLVFALLERGEVERAEAALELPGGEQRWAVNISYGVYVIARAAVWHAQGRSEEALEQLRVAEQLGRAVNARHAALLPWRPLIVRILLERGDGPEAARHAQDDVDEARRFGAPGPLGAALRGLGLAIGGAEGVELLRESERTLAPSPARLEHARTLVELGAAVRRAGEPSEARDRLREGLDAAHRCGATALVERALEELRVAGARPRRPALSGVAALTPAELRVAELASRGLSNREVAQRLFVTRRTVEMHLSSVYGKLEIDSRKELGAALGDA